MVATGGGAGAVGGLQVTCSRGTLVLGVVHPSQPALADPPGPGCLKRGSPKAGSKCLDAVGELGSQACQGGGMAWVPGPGLVNPPLNVVQDGATAKPACMSTTRLP